MFDILCLVQHKPQGHRLNFHSIFLEKLVVQRPIIVSNQLPTSWWTIENIDRQNATIFRGKNSFRLSFDFWWHKGKTFSYWTVLLNFKSSLCVQLVLRHCSIVLSSWCTVTYRNSRIGPLGARHFKNICVHVLRLMVCINCVSVCGKTSWLFTHARQIKNVCFVAHRTRVFFLFCFVFFLASGCWIFVPFPEFLAGLFKPFPTGNLGHAIVMS